MNHRRILVFGSAVVLSLSLLATGLAPAALAGVGGEGSADGCADPHVAVLEKPVHPAPDQRRRPGRRPDGGAAPGRTVIAFQQSLHTVVITAPASALAKLSRIPGVGQDLADRHLAGLRLELGELERTGGDAGLVQQDLELGQVGLVAFLAGQAPLPGA